MDNVDRFPILNRRLVCSLMFVEQEFTDGQDRERFRTQHVLGWGSLELLTALRP